MHGAISIYAIYAEFTPMHTDRRLIAKKSLRVYAIYAQRAHTYAHANTRPISLSHARIYT